MKGGRFFVLVILALMLSSSSQQARSQTLDCSTIPKASEYGTDLSVCRMPDESVLRCSQDNGGLSHCQVQHTNGFISGTNGADAGPLPIILAAISEHRARKAERHLLNAVDLEIKGFSLLSDWLTMTDLITAHVSTPPATWLQLQQDYRELQKQMLANLFGAKDLLTGQFIYPSQYKGMHQLHDLSILAECPMANVIAQMNDPFRRSILPEDVLRAMNAVDSDLATLKADCSTRDAVRLLAKDRQTTSPSAAKH